MHFKSRKFSLELGIIFWIAAASVGLFGCEGLLLSSCLPLAVSVPAGYLLWSEKSHPFLENFLIKKNLLVSLSFCSVLLISKAAQLCTVEIRFVSDRQANKSK